jgi:outer membrane protein
MSKKLYFMLAMTCLASLFSSLIYAQGNQNTVLNLKLEDAYRMALDNSSGLKATRSETEVGKAKLKEANSMFMPELNFSETYLRSNDQVAVFGSKLRQGQFTAQDFDIGLLNNPASVNNFESKISMNMPIFTSGMNYYTRKAAKAGIDASEHSTKHAESTIKMNIAKVYYGLVSSDESASYIDDGIKQLEKLERTYKLLSAPTSATTTSYLLSQATRIALSQRRQTVETTRRSLETTIKSILELPENTEIRPSDGINENIEIGTGGDSDVKQQREDIKTLEFSLAALKFQKKSVYSMLGPRIDFFGTYAFNTPDFDKGEDAYQIGFVLTLNIFNYSRYGRLDEIRARENQVSLVLKENSKNANSSMVQASDTFMGKKEELKFAKTSFEKADEALRFADIRYREGTLPLKDYSEAVAKWVEAKVNVAKTRYELVSSYVDYEFERGAL